MKKSAGLAVDVPARRAVLLVARDKLSRFRQKVRLTRRPNSAAAL